MLKLREVGAAANLQLVLTNNGEVRRVTRSRGDGRSRVTTGFGVVAVRFYESRRRVFRCFKDRY